VPALSTGLQTFVSFTRSSARLEPVRDLDLDALRALRLRRRLVAEEVLEVVVHHARGVDGLGQALPTTRPSLRANSHTQAR
jgi:hypothetical protein